MLHCLSTHIRDLDVHSGIRETEEQAAGANIQITINNTKCTNNYHFPFLTIGHVSEVLPMLLSFLSPPLFAQPQNKTKKLT